MSARGLSGLNGKCAIVTGAGRGLGRAIALRLAHEGTNVLVNDIDERNAETTARMLVDIGVKSSVSTHDVSDPFAAEKMVEQAETTLGSLDILVNNAGILRDAMLHKMSVEEFDRVIEVNLKGVFLCTQEFVKRIKSRGNRGSIVNIASISYLGNIGQTNYAAAKAGVCGMTRTWGLELARANVRVNGIAPGLIETDMAKSTPEEIRNKMTEKIPLKRLGRPEEVAALTAFLASEDSSYMTGQILHLCGGASVGGL